MKKSILRFISVLLLIISLSCDDSVDPKSAFAERYILNCVINLDTTYQVATVSKTFDVDGYDPNKNSIDPFISNAVVKLYYNDTVYTMKDTSKIRTDTLKYKTPLHFYYTNNLIKARLALPITVKASMPDGTILEGSTYFYSLSRFYVSSSKKEITPPPLGTGSSSSDLYFEWGDVYSSNGYSGLYFSPELVILYSYEMNGTVVNLEKKVALSYTGDYAVYPQIATRINNITFLFDNINKALNEISKDDPYKENFRIRGALFRILMMDSNLAAYYSSQKTFLDEFSVRVNQPDFSNVQNGFGIVGSFSMRKLQLKIDKSFISSFGYKY